MSLNYILLVAMMGLSSLVLGGSNCILMDRHTICPVNSSASQRSIDVEYPNLGICKLRLLTSKFSVSEEELGRLAAGLRFTLNDAFVGKEIVLRPEVKVDLIELGVGVTQLYMAPVTFATKSGESLNRLIQRTLGSAEHGAVLVVVVPVQCRGE